MSAPTSHRRDSEAIILVHGLMANRMVMAPLARKLGRAFGSVVNWGYRSLWSPIQRHGRELASLLKKLDENSVYERVHLVTHSMGGIIARVALHEYQPRRLGRFVMITPPNRGSHVASQLAPYLGKLCPPLLQLQDCDQSFVCKLAPPQVPDLGIIAADKDFLVMEASTRLDCTCDHIVLPGLHSSLLWSTATAEQVKHFLEHGRFQRAAESAAGDRVPFAAPQSPD